jgi:hypothetical protein
LYLAILLIAISLVSVQVGAYYDLERLFLSNNTSTQNTGSHARNGSGNHTGNASVISVNTLLNFGNGTSKWFNDTRIPLGWNLYNLTVYVTNDNVESIWDPGFKEHFITGIDGVPRSGSNSFDYWALWQFCNNDRAWLYSNVGADEITLSNNQIVAWYFELAEAPPVPGAKTVLMCSS